MKNMRNLRKVSFFGMAILISTMISCSNDDADELTLISEEKTVDISGVYTGTLKTEGTEKISEATFEVTMLDSMNVEIHCYGEEMDTTFMMHMYEYGDSIMICYTDSIFMMEYGHHMSDSTHGMGDNGMGDGSMGDGGMMGDGNGMGSNGMMNWMDHMDEEHDSTDMHYGGFDMTNQSCDYTIKINDGDNEILKRFQGTKN